MNIAVILNNDDKTIRECIEYCPICGEKHTVELHNKVSNARVHGQLVQYNELYYMCTLCEPAEEKNTFVTATMMNDNLLRARDAYRIAKGLLTSSEIRAVRGKYGLSQKDFSLLLGGGEVSVTRNEAHVIQSETRDNTMRLFERSPKAVLDSLKSNKDKFSEEKFKIIHDNILNLLLKQQSEYINYDKILSYIYKDYMIPSVCNGGVALNIPKLKNMVLFYAKNMTNLYKVKMMKLLWYTDALCYKRNGVACTGLVYEHQKFGALPLGNEIIIQLDTLDTEEIEIHNEIAYNIKPAADVELELSVFDESQIVVMDIILNKFKNISTNNFIDFMHKEVAYTNTVKGQIIPFILCKELSL